MRVVSRQNDNACNRGILKPLLEDITRRPQSEGASQLTGLERIVAYERYILHVRRPVIFISRMKCIPDEIRVLRTDVLLA
jgi:hypothetical protein